MSLDPNRSLDDEVVRVESVGFLEGATGHGVFTLACLVLSGLGYWITGWLAFPVGGISTAFLVSANGLSIYLWHEVTSYVRERDAADESTTDTEQRRLSVSLSPSTAYKSGFVASMFQVTILVVTLGVVVTMYQRLAPETASLVLAGALTLGNGGALVLAYMDLT